jgi:uncharacterized protein YciI
MHYMVLGYDGTDAQALERRLAVREEHLSLARKMYDDGTWLYAVAILDDNGRMIGSMIICDFASKEKLESEWLQQEPYVRGHVWQKIEIHRVQVAPFCLPK